MALPHLGALTAPTLPPAPSQASAMTSFRAFRGVWRFPETSLTASGVSNSGRNIFRFGVWNLGFFWELVFGIWCLDSPLPVLRSLFLAKEDPRLLLPSVLATPQRGYSYQPSGRARGPSGSDRAPPWENVPQVLSSLSPSDGEEGSRVRGPRLPSDLSNLGYPERFRERFRGWLSAIPTPRLDVLRQVFRFCQECFLRWAGSRRICGVEEWRGGVKAGHNCVRPFRLPVSEYPAIRFVSIPRSSNLPIQLVIESVKPAGRFPLRFSLQRLLKLPDTFRSY